LFITIACGAISGFHALVSSGTTPKMMSRERHARVIGYGAMLTEGMVAVVAMLAAASLGPRDYYAMNTELSEQPAYHDRILAVGGGHGVEEIGRYEGLTQEALRGRTGGAVTLAVGMAHVFEQAAKSFGATAQHTLNAMWKYWYHFAIMFEALFILTTIDAGTRIGRFLVQEVGGKLHPSLGRTNWWPGSFAATAGVVGAWAWFMNSDSFSMIWQMFGIANQLLAILALSVVASWLANEGRVRYVAVVLVPAAVLTVTTGSAAGVKLGGLFAGIATQLGNPASPGRTAALLNAALQAGLILAMLGCAAVVVGSSLLRVRRAWGGAVEPAAGFGPAEALTPPLAAAGRVAVAD
ncbi:MAG: cstA, partial [Phycisphaerales bacterium]|nr:cstA [Phycisphaerales bacterium]